jgi:GNAT superfamily N-acetyltransferase
MTTTPATGWPLSERLERVTLLALHEYASAEVRDRLGLAIEEIDGTLVSIARHDPSIMLNRAIGLGLTRPASAATIEAIRSCYRDAGAGRFFLHVHPDSRPPECADLLAAAGLRPHRRWMKFERGTEPPPAPRTDLQVRPIDAAHGEDFGRIVAPAFDLSPTAAGLFPGLIDQPGFHLYMSFDGDAPAGTGLLYIDGEDAWLDWGATLQACRGRGSQRALLARRVEDAIAAGCKRLLTATGEAVPDDPQHSYHNIEWAGFRPVYLRENWVPADPA